MSPSVVSTLGIVFAIGGVGRVAVSAAARVPGACARAGPEVAAKAPSAKSRRVGRVSMGRSNYGPKVKDDRAPRAAPGSLLRWRPGGSDESQALLEVRLDGVGDDAPLVRVDEGGGDPRPIGIHAALPQLLNDAGEPLIVAARLELPCVHVALQLLQLFQEPLDRNRWHRVLLLR